jgi:3-oxoacyl-(acyl-carrier-protein) synthase
MGGGYLPATLNHHQPDAPSQLDFIADGPRPARIDVALSSSFAFGGNNTVLVFARA